MNRPALAVLSMLFLCLLLPGCTATYDPRSAATDARSLDILRDGQKPSRKYTEVAVLKDDGRVEEQDAIEAKMLRKAKSMGANGIIVHPPVKSGTEAILDLFGSVKTTYLYRGTVFRYD